jgi:hypothetical protein
MIMISTSGNFFTLNMLQEEALGNVVVDSLCFKSEGRGFEIDEINEFNLPNTSGRARP